MNELTLLRLLLYSKSYKLYYNTIDIKNIKDNNREIYYIYKALNELREKLPDKDFSVEELKAYFNVLYPDAKAEIYDGLFESISAAEISEEVGDSILAQVKRNQAALKLSQKAFDYTQGRATLADLEQLSDELRSDVVEKDQIVEDDMDLNNLINSAFKEDGLRWRLDFLNKSLGSLRPGDFGFMMKRPEAGGTAFCASEVGFMLGQTDRNIVWINNEEANDKVKLRVYQSYFGVPLQELIGNAEYFYKRFQDEVQGRFKFFGIDRSNKRDIERIIERYNPILVLYDQLDKVTGFDADREDLKLGAIYEWARNLTKRGHSGLAITQADGTAEGVKWLDMRHVANAKTSKQAEADFILGMGRSSEPSEADSRYLTVCKNKLLGSQDSIPAFRHGRMEVQIIPEIMRFADYQKYD